MADSKTFTISTITRGMCLETRPNSKLSTGKYDSGGKTQAQLWNIEQSEDKKSVAFRSVANGQYLRSANKGDAQKALTGDKAWWTVEPGDAPGSWWLRNNDFGNYLNNLSGYQTPNNTVQMWSSNLQGWAYVLLWYINPATAPGPFSPSESAGSSTRQKEKEELEAKEKVLKEREQKAEADEKEAVERENAAVEREKAVAEKEQKAEARVKAIADMESSTKQRSSDIEAKEKVLTERTEKLEKREQAIADKETKGSGNTGGPSQVSDLQRQLADTQRELEEAKAALQKQAAEAKQKDAERDSTPSGSSVSGADADEIRRLRQRVKELESRPTGSTPPPTTIPTGSVQRDRNGLKPIVVQQNFGFIPRLTDSGVRDPLPTSMPPRTMPPKLSPVGRLR